MGVIKLCLAQPVRLHPAFWRHPATKLAEHSDVALLPGCGGKRLAAGPAGSGSYWHCLSNRLSSSLEGSLTFFILLIIIMIWVLWFDR